MYSYTELGCKTAHSYTVRLQNCMYGYTELGCKTLCIVIVPAEQDPLSEKERLLKRAFSKKSVYSKE